MGQLSVAIVNYESAEPIGQLLGQLDTDIDRAVIVDNQSSDEDRHALAAVTDRHRWVDVVYSHENGGFGRGVNQAIEHLAGRDEDIVWILNPDIALSVDAATRLRRWIEDGSVDIVSPLILAGSPDSDRVWYAGGNVDWRRGSTTHAHWGASAQALAPGLHPTTFIPGAAPMMSIATWRRLRGFREDFFLYFEDADLCLRALEMGLRLGVDRSTPVWHAEGGSSDGEGRGHAYYEYMGRNRVRFFSEWAPDQRWPARRRRDVETLRLVARALREPEDRGGKARAVLRGHLRGAREQRRRR